MRRSGDGEEGYGWQATWRRGRLTALGSEVNKASLYCLGPGTIPLTFSGPRLKGNSTWKRELRLRPVTPQSQPRPASADHEMAVMGRKLRGRPARLLPRLAPPAGCAARQRQPRRCSRCARTSAAFGCFPAAALPPAGRPHGAVPSPRGHPFAVSTNHFDPALAPRCRCHS
eukprot:COSAG06_NODE_685_length_13103_cov_126.328668_11_plen_171_part_00